MSNIQVFNPGANVPAFARQGLSETAKALAGGGGGGKRISIKGGVFRLLVDGKEVTAIDERFLDVVIIKAAPKISRVFYTGQYDDTNPTPPDCWSQDGDVPSPDAENPQASRCAECPQNIAGSGQGQSRACRHQQRLAVVLANDVEGDVMQLTLPATSIFGKAEGDNRPLQEYARWLVAQEVNPEAVVTRLRFDTSVQQPKLFFKAVRWLTEEEYEAVQAAAESPDAKRAITMALAKMDNVTGKPADEVAALPGKPPAKAASKPVAVSEPEDEEEAPPPPPKARSKATKAASKPAAAPAEDDAGEPEVRPAKTAKTAKPAVEQPSSLTSMIDEWDDE